MSPSHQLRDYEKEGKGMRYKVKESEKMFKENKTKWTRKYCNEYTNQFLQSLGLCDSICVEYSSETLRICHTSWQSCYFLYIFKYLTPQVISEKKNITQI